MQQCAVRSAAVVSGHRWTALKTRTPRRTGWRVRVCGAPTAASPRSRCARVSADRASPLQTLWGQRLCSGRFPLHMRASLPPEVVTTKKTRERKKKGGGGSGENINCRETPKQASWCFCEDLVVLERMSSILIIVVVACHGETGDSLLAWFLRVLRGVSRNGHVEVKTEFVFLRRGTSWMMMLQKDKLIPVSSPMRFTTQCLLVPALVARLFHLCK